MKRIISIYLLIAIFLVGCVDSELPIIEETDGVASGTALIITGAAARINQQLALIERLDNQGLLDDLQFISGVSSGAINAVMINGVLDSTNGFGWENYKNIVLNLDNADILDNAENNLPVDTRPLGNTFGRIFTDTLGYNALTDLPIPTALSCTDLDLLQIRIASNVSELNEIDGDIVESAMASAAFPVAFPSIKIGDAVYVDGGLVENIPVIALLKYEQLRGAPFAEVYIISYEKNEVMQWDRELAFLGLSGLREDLLEVSLKKSGFDTDQQSQQTFFNDLIRIDSVYPLLSARSFIYVPEISDSSYYGVFDFSSETAQNGYNEVSNWALSNDPVSIGGYLFINGLLD